LRERPEAHIVNVASIFGFVVTNRTLAYHVSKFGLIGFTEGLRAEFASRGIGATAVCPGFVTTNLFASGQCGYAGRTAPIPPRWVSTTPDSVAAKTIRGIYLNRRLVLVTPLAYLLYYAKRFAPGLLDGLYRVRRRAKGKAETAPVVTPHPAMLRG
jgi:short-subunit dehydrogenase